MKDNTSAAISAGQVKCNASCIGCCMGGFFITTWPMLMSLAAVVFLIYRGDFYSLPKPFYSRRAIAMNKISTISAVCETYPAFSA